MSRKSALGDIPSFNINDSVKTINGIPITNQQEDPKSEANEKRFNDIQEYKNIINKYKNKVMSTEEKEALTTKEQREIKDKDAEAIEKKPSNKTRLMEGYTRHTFAVKDEQLELLRAIALYKDIEQKILLEKLLDRALEDIDKDTKQEALKQYKAEDRTDQLIDIFN